MSLSLRVAFAAMMVIERALRVITTQQSYIAVQIVQRSSTQRAAVLRREKEVSLYSNSNCVRVSATRTVPIVGGTTYNLFTHTLVSDL